jgi:iduronate 2-sulfatase
VPPFFLHLQTSPHLLKHLLLLSILCSLATLSSAAPPPNILFIVADDLNSAIGPYGDKAARTPQLDRLAARGLVFERAYCQQAVCNPSRSSFLTGLRPDTVGVDDLRKSFRDTSPSGKTLITLPQHFKNQGWFCQNIGKLFHNMGDTQDRQSWSIDEVLHTGTHADDTLFTNTPTPSGTEKPTYKAPITEASDVPDTAYRDGQIARLAAAVVRDRADQKQPFFLAVGFWRPHLPFVAPKKYWDLYDPAQIPAANPPDRPQDAPDIALHASSEIRGYGLTPKDRAINAAEQRHYRHGYYASISFMDAQIGLILDALDESGQADNTIIVFFSDHGFHIGEHTLWGKTTNFELDARVPFIIADPRQKASHGQRTRALAELVDLYPTLAQLTDTASTLPKNLEGHNLAPVLADPSATVKEAAFTQHQQPFYGPRNQWKAIGRSIRTDSWRCTEWRDIRSGAIMAHELYDHQIDPLETQNRATHPEHATPLADLKTALRQHFKLEN